MMFSLSSLAPSTLSSRWRSLDDKGLWLVLAGIVGSYLFLLSLLTQMPDEAINVALVLGGPGWCSRASRKDGNPAQAG